MLATVLFLRVVRGNNDVAFGGHFGNEFGVEDGSPAGWIFMYGMGELVAGSNIGTIFSF